ncbi:MAG TPA: hypothetical protein VHW60_10200 [Caulobacteraceae bacterium]|nr:hypothetical protein [Caulobacteraceae bacterium]
MVGTGWIAAREGRAAGRREEAQRIAAKTAALNLAVLAHTHVKRMGELLRDESTRGRLNHISPSRSLLSNQQMLASFPLESLENVDAMVAFTYFPGALAMAAEIYAHLEEAVRAAEDDDPVAVFEHYAAQIAGIEQHLDGRLAELKAALNLADGVGAGHGARLFEARRHTPHKRAKAR